MTPPTPPPTQVVTRDAYLAKIRPYLGTPLVIVLTGMRRVGKSVLLRLLAQDLRRAGTPDEAIVFVDYEQLSNAPLLDPVALDAYVREQAERAGRHVTVLLDEVQDMTGWERAVNSLRGSLDCDIVITGSNSRLLSSDLATLIAGRYVEIPVHPFSFAEAVSLAPDMPVGDAFERYLRFGALPGVHELPQDGPVIDAYLRDVFNSVLLRDVVASRSIRNVDLLRRVIEFTMTNVGQTFSAKRVSDFLKSQRRSVSAETVYNYLDALAGAFAVRKVSRYDIKGKRLLETQEKYFFADTGLVNAVLGPRGGDLAAGLLENVVCGELIRRDYDVHIGKAGAAEVDFVADRRGERLYIQVALALTTPEVRRREFAPLRAIRDNYPKYVLTMEPGPTYTEDGIVRRYLPDFLLDQTW